MMGLRGRPQWIALLFGAAMAGGFASGCATTSYPKVELREESFVGKPMAVVNDIPFVEQTPKLCGPTALYMAAKKHLPELSLNEVTNLAYTPLASGAYKQDMLSATRRIGLAPYRVESMDAIFDHLARGTPIVLFHRTKFLWKDYWHYSVVTGYDRRDENFLVHIGPYEHREADISKLMGSWKEGGNWAFVVLPASELPVTATVEEATENSLAFLRLDRPDAAYSIASEMAKRWPDRYEADVVLAEVMMKRNEPQEALRALERAHRKEPKNEILSKKILELSRAHSS
jgi:hypothetical protein